MPLLFNHYFKEPLSLFYTAKPSYGGWVSFTAHLTHLTQSSIFKIAKRTEKRTRDFGYGCNYRNITTTDFLDMESIPKKCLFLAIDKYYYSQFEEFLTHPKSQSLDLYLVIHDPTELAGKKALPLLTLLQNNKNVRLITIRPRVQKHVQEQYGLSSLLMYHPFYRFPTTNNLLDTTNVVNSKFVSIARIDHDKHTDIITQANQRLLQDQKIKIYGAMNGFYAYKTLHKYDPMRKDDPESQYQGTFAKDWSVLQQIIRDNRAGYVVDLSIIKGDGGHTQYSFLEAIYLDCVLVLHRKWIQGSDSIFKEGVNCLAVENSEELEQLVLSPLNTHKYQAILQNSKSLILT